MHTITHAIDTRPFFLLSVLSEEKRPGNEANLVPKAYQQLSYQIWNSFLLNRNISLFTTVVLQCTQATPITVHNDKQLAKHSIEVLGRSIKKYTNLQYFL